MSPAATLPPMDPEQADRLERITANRSAVDRAWREEIRAAVASGASLRDVAAAAGISHTAVKNIAEAPQT